MRNHAVLHGLPVELRVLPGALATAATSPPQPPLGTAPPINQASYDDDDGANVTRLRPLYPQEHPCVKCLHGACLSVERCLSALAFVRRTSYKMCVVHSRPSRSVHREPRVTLCCQCVPWACSHDLRIFLVPIA